MSHLRIIYVGISNRSLRARDYRNHFNGNARGSTLRKSLGPLFHFIKLKEENNLSKYRFVKEDEERLSMWMKKYLRLHYCVSDTPNEIEKLLISELNPPLNIKDNKNDINIEFRKHLMESRR